MLREILLNMTEDDYSVLKESAEKAGMKVEEFIIDAMWEKIDDSMEINEERVLKAMKDVEEGKFRDHEEVWKRLEIDDTP